MARKIIYSARGKAVDFDALKAATPKKSKRDRSNPIEQRNSIVIPRVPKLNLEIPAPRPIQQSEDIEKDLNEAIASVIDEIDIFEGKPSKKRG